MGVYLPLPSVIRNWDVPASSLVQNSAQVQPSLAITQSSFGEMVPYGTQPCVQQAGDLPTLGPTFSMANHIPTIVQVNPGSLTQEATPGAIVIGYDNEGIPIYHQPALGQVWTLQCCSFQKFTPSKLVAFRCSGGLVCQ